nr:MAG TPA: hypothetical protein [Caudoviricetes sp.]
MKLPLLVFLQSLVFAHLLRLKYFLCLSTSQKAMYHHIGL